MQAIYKYPLEIIGSLTDVQVPLGAKPLSVANVRDQVCLYCLVDLDEDQMVSLPIAIYGTDTPHYGISGTFLGTVLDGPYVWHVFIP